MQFIIASVTFISLSDSSGMASKIEYSNIYLPRMPIFEGASPIFGFSTLKLAAHFTILGSFISSFVALTRGVARVSSFEIKFSIPYESLISGENLKYSR